MHKLFADFLQDQRVNVWLTVDSVMRKERLRQEQVTNPELEGYRHCEEDNALSRNSGFIDHCGLLKKDEPIWLLLIEQAKN